MRGKSKVYVAGIGMITPVGVNVEMTAAAVRAGVSAYRDTSYFDGDFNKIRMAVVPEAALENSLDEDKLTLPMTARHVRMLQLAKLALLEVLPRLPRDQSVPLFLAGPEPLGTEDQPLTMSFIKILSVQTSANLNLDVCRINSMGRAGGLSCVKLAYRYLESGAGKLVLVGGVDSFYDKSTVDSLSSKRRLLSGEAMDGFIPGEGAGFMLLTNDSKTIAKEQLPHIFEPGGGLEQGHMFSDKPYTGDGLSAAVTEAVRNSNATKIAVIYTTMNGESFFAKEHGVALIRNKESLHENVKIEHPADCFGDLGAASGIVMAALSSYGLVSKNYSGSILLMCSSDREHRSAAVIHA